MGRKKKTQDSPKSLVDQVIEGNEEEVSEEVQSESEAEPTRKEAYIEHLKSWESKAEEKKRLKSEKVEENGLCEKVPAKYRKFQK
jgi:hypothetical protein